MAARKKVQSPVTIVTRVPDLLMTPHDAPKLAAKIQVVPASTSTETKTEAKSSASSTSGPETQKSTDVIGPESIMVAANTQPHVEKSVVIEKPPETEKPAATISNWNIPEFVQHAAAVAAAVVAGGILGAAATASIMHVASQASFAAYQTASHKLNDDIANLRISIDNTQRDLSAQYETIRERVRYTEEKQNEPNAQLAKLAEGLDRLERRLQPIIASNNHSSINTTGSIPSSRETLKSQMTEGWRVRDYRSGHVVVQDSTGRSFEVTLGTNLPGLGQVEAVKRDNGRIIVITKNGVISSSPDQKQFPARAPARQ